MKTVRIATRNSALALVQANQVKAQLQRLSPGIEYTLVPIVTLGDKVTDTPLFLYGGKGVFVKALEEALLRGEADIAVHSMKDMTVLIPEGLCLGAIMEREDPRDAFISNEGPDIESLPPKAVIGTVSLRRHYQLRVKRNDLVVHSLRGNVDTRLKKLDAGLFQGIILAMAGLIRLGQVNRVTTPLDVGDFLPAPGQGALGIECRDDDAFVKKLIAPLHHVVTATCVLAERAVVRELGGSCQVPVAAHAKIVDSNDLNTPLLSLTGEIGCKDTLVVLRGSLVGAVDQAVELGREVGQMLLSQGADSIIQHYTRHSNDESLS